MQYLSIPVILFQLFFFFIQSAAYGWLGVFGLFLAYGAIVTFSLFMVGWLSYLMFIQLGVQTLFFLWKLGVL